MSHPSHDAAAVTATHYEIRFQSLYDSGRGLSFPCDAQGRVGEEHLSERARLAYRRAQSLVGREYATPAVQLSDLH
ncbi:hypothetical protein [Sphaerotilus mobilis]|uniref:Uncharacterized protein n=1 Tax=Sphaerotilus mobilis TaxID=47994 RepID=A0A4Q7LQV2_9BURK|nr:hypothetical protein [Sphaerotilus mobilis]RZS57074.1 hypothetical protein EV685_1637 [Sphaerotilus mobilis]